MHNEAALQADLVAQTRMNYWNWGDLEPIYLYMDLPNSNPSFRKALTSSPTSTHVRLMAGALRVGDYTFSWKSYEFFLRHITFVCHGTFKLSKLNLI